MKRNWALALCALLLCLACAGLAEEAPPLGGYAGAREALALEAGLALEDSVTFAWGGLPLLDDEQNDVLESLLSALALRQRTQGDARLFDALLQGVSVLDLSMWTSEGVYYESSNLLGGQTVAFSAGEFADFAARLSARSSGVLPPNLDLLYSAVVRALGGEDVIEIDTDTLDESMAALADWRERALTVRETLRPTTHIPGLYGARAKVTDVTRGEAIVLAQAYADLLVHNEALWLQAARAQQPDADAPALEESARQIAQQLRALPTTLEAWLPEDLPPAEYREIWGAGEMLVAHQLEVTLPGGAYLFAEWTPEGADVPMCYVAAALDDLSLSLLLTREAGVPMEIGQVTRLRNRTIAQGSLSFVDVTLDITMTRTENIERRREKESILVKTDLALQSAALLGEGAVVTLTIQETDTASGAPGEDYARRRELVLRLKGLGFDSRDILTVSARTKATDPVALPMPAEDALLRPARMDDAALDAWLAEIAEVYTVQTWYTVLGRLPADVARHALDLMRQ